MRLGTTVAPPADARDEALNRPGESQVVGEDDGLDPVPCADLGEDPPDVGLHRRLRQREPLRDLAVGEAVADGDEDLALAAGQGVQPGILPHRPAEVIAEPVGERVEQPPSQRRRDHRVPGGPDASEQLLRADVLQQETARPGPQRGERVLVLARRTTGGSPLGSSPDEEDLGSVLHG